MAKSNFFDAIGVADMEKVHSAVIGWMLSDNCTAFGEGENGRKIRSALLQKIFGISEHLVVFDSIEYFVEWKNIDILIVTECNRDEECWVIENKIKSSQHSDQLNRYVDIMNCEFLLPSKAYKDDCFNSQDTEKIADYIKGLRTKKITNPYASCKKHFCFLTLIEEKANCTRANVSWNNCKYEQLHQFLKEALDQSRQFGKDPDREIIIEYRSCIETLKQALNSFLEKHIAYKNVFTDGDKTKEEKIIEWSDPHFSHPKGDYAKYISDNGLETIFQKCFLTIIAKGVGVFVSGNYNIDDTRGNALLDYPFGKLEPYTIQFQFQNGSYKVQIIGDNSQIQQFNNDWNESIIESILEKLGAKWQFNKSKKDAKSYLSFSKPRDPQWYKDSLETIKTNWAIAFIDCIKAKEIIIDIYNEKNSPSRKIPANTGIGEF